MSNNLYRYQVNKDNDTSYEPKSLCGIELVGKITTDQTVKRFVCV